MFFYKQPSQFQQEGLRLSSNARKELELAAIVVKELNLLVQESDDPRVANKSISVVLRNKNCVSLEKFVLKQVIYLQKYNSVHKIIGVNV